MPRRCCICQVSGKVRYNEIPSDPILRDKWLAVIPEKEDLGVNPVVCDSHFEESDYMPDRKVRRLKRDVVPKIMINEENYVDLQVEMVYKRRYLNFYSNKKIEKNLNLKEVDSKIKEVSESRQNIIKESKGIRKKVDNPQHLHQFSSEENKWKMISVQSLIAELNDLKSKCVYQESELKNRDATILDLQKRLLKVEALGNKKKLYEEDTSVKDYENEIEALQSVSGKEGQVSTQKRDKAYSIYCKKIKEMIQSRCVHRKAAFLLDQLKLYNTKAPKYSDSTILECLMWEDADPSGYQHARESELLTLPSTKTMRKYLDPTVDDIDFEVNSSDKIASMSNAGRIGKDHLSSTSDQNNQD